MVTTASANGEATAVIDPTNDGEDGVILQQPYVVEVKIEGAAPLLFHRWSVEGVASKAKAAKGSVEKKSDNIESYVYRTPTGAIGIPGVYLVGSVIDPKNGAAKYRQDPRSPRKSALDLYRAGVIALDDVTPIISAGSEVPAETWDYLDARRVMVQRQGITRVRPAFLAGWRASFMLQVLTPEYIRPGELLDVLTQAGRLVGLGDFRPSHGRFRVTSFDVLG